MKVLLRTITTITAIFGVLTYIYRAIFVNHRSVGSELAEDVIRVATFDNTTADEELLERKEKENSDEYEIPTSLFRSNIDHYFVSDMKVYTVSPDEVESHTRVLYLHGGGYINQPSPFHWRFINKLVKETGLEFIVPIYPKVPVHTYEKAYEQVQVLYEQLISENDDLIIMGDSAGGGLTLGLVQYLYQQSKTLPKAQIVICPWMDVSLNNPEIENFIEVEPMLKREKLQVIGKLWRGDTDYNNYKVSPVYGNVIDLPKVYIFAGTREILVPDIRKYVDRLEDEGADFEYFEFEEQNHVFPLYPVKEGIEARRMIENILIDLREEIL